MTTVQEAFNQQTAVHEDPLRLKQELEQVKDQLVENKYKVLNAKAARALVRRGGGPSCLPRPR